MNEMAWQQMTNHWRCFIVSKKSAKMAFQKKMQNANKSVMWAEKAGSKNIDKIKTTINNWFNKFFKHDDTPNIYLQNVFIYRTLKAFYFLIFDPICQ